MAAPPGTAPYRDVKITAVAPNSTTSFELQFHTAESLRVKNLNHSLYAESRKLDMDNPRLSELNTRMLANTNQIPRPPRVESISI